MKYRRESRHILLDYNFSFILFFFFSEKKLGTNQKRKPGQDLHREQNKRRKGSQRVRGKKKEREMEKVQLRYCWRGLKSQMKEWKERCRPEKKNVRKIIN